MRQSHPPVVRFAIRACCVLAMMAAAPCASVWLIPRDEEHREDSKDSKARWLMDLGRSLCGSCARKLGSCDGVVSLAGPRGGGCLPSLSGFGGGCRGSSKSFSVSGLLASICRASPLAASAALAASALPPGWMRPPKEGRWRTKPGSPSLAMAALTEVAMAPMPNAQQHSVEAPETSREPSLHTRTRRPPHLLT